MKAQRINKRIKHYITRKKNILDVRRITKKYGSYGLATVLMDGVDRGEVKLPDFKVSEFPVELFKIKARRKGYLESLAKYWLGVSLRGEEVGRFEWSLK